MSILFYITLLLAFFYLTLLLIYVIGWWHTTTIEVPTDFEPSLKMTVIVPARNEALYIEQCIRSISENYLNRQLFEIIVINDHSTDDTKMILDNLVSEIDNLKVIDLESEIPTGLQLNSFKKYALQLAISQAQGDIIVTTDADCIVAPNWLRYFAYMFEVKNANFVTAPVVFYDEKNMLQRFQTLDFMGMMCVTAASLKYKLAAMSNGANLAYKKQIFDAVNGFEGVNHLASGDDMLLMEKIVRYTKNQNIFYLKSSESIVKTIPARTLKDFFNQRVRWASKSKVYESWATKLVLTMVLLFNVLIVVGFLLWLFGILAYSFFLIPFLIKMFADFIFLFSTSLFFKRTDLIIYFLPAQIWHLLYICSVGVWGNIGSYEWKGRKVQ